MAVNLSPLRRWPLFVLLWLLVPAGPAVADVFAVRVSVAAEGSDSQAARDAALEQGHLAAWERLLRRLVVDEDLPGAPRLSAAEVRELLAGLEVLTEEIRRTRYSGTLSFRFDPERVRPLLAARGLRFTETPSRPVVVLPLLGEGEQAQLWQGYNAWRLAWADRWGGEGLVPLVVPLGELEDVALADAPQALAGDEAALAALAKRYGTGETLVAQALVAGDPAAGGARLTLKAIRHGPLAGAPFTLTLAQETGEGEGALFARAVEAVAARLESDWKQANGFYYGTQSSLPVTVAITSLQDWLTIRQVLDSAPLVIRVQVLGISAAEARIVIEHRGTPEQLALWLAQQDLILEAGPEGHRLRAAEAAGAVEQKPLGIQ